jgi:secreted Zn-dependent insulinase-like peptidase
MLSADASECIESTHFAYFWQPETYVASLIKHGGPGTLKYVLKLKNLCTTIDTEYHTYAGIGFFTIIFNLTQEGLKEVDSIVKKTFQVSTRASH